MIDEDVAQSYFDDHFYMAEGEMCEIPGSEPDDFWDDDEEDDNLTNE